MGALVKLVYFAYAAGSALERLNNIVATLCAGRGKENIDSTINSDGFIREYAYPFRSVISAAACNQFSYFDRRFRVYRFDNDKLVRERTNHRLCCRSGNDEFPEICRRKTDCILAGVSENRRRRRQHRHSNAGRNHICHKLAEYIRRRTGQTT